MVKDFVKLLSNQEKIVWLVFVMVTRLVEAQCGPAGAFGVGLIAVPVSY